MNTPADQYRRAQQLATDVESIRCPGNTCLAPAGEPCRNPPATGWHTLRFAAAMAAEFTSITGAAYDPNDTHRAGLPPPPRRRHERTGHRVLT